MFNNRHHDTTSIERYVGQSSIEFIYDVTRKSTIHGCMNLIGPKQVHLRNLLASVNTKEYMKVPVMQFLKSSSNGL